MQKFWKDVLQYVWVCSVIGFALWVIYFILSYVFHQMFNSDFFSYDSLSQTIIIALIGGVASGLLVEVSSKHFILISRSETTSLEKNEIQRPDVTNYMNPSNCTSANEMDNFCKSVIAWKVAASRKDEMFTLFKENPYYLMGFLAYLTQKNIEESKKIERRITRLTVITAIIALGSMIFAMYSVKNEFFISTTITVVILLLAVWYVDYKFKANTEN
jgi:hypothetical protein